MIVKVRAKLTPKLDHPIHQHRPLPELILELELLDSRPVHLGHLAPAQSTILLMHNRQIMGGLLGHLGRLFVENTGRVCLDAAVEDKREGGSVDSGELVCRVGQGAGGESSGPKRRELGRFDVYVSADDQVISVVELTVFTRFLVRSEQNKHVECFAIALLGPADQSRRIPEQYSQVSRIVLLCQLSPLAQTWQNMSSPHSAISRLDLARRSSKLQPSSSQPSTIPGSAVRLRPRGRKKVECRYCRGHS